MNRRTNSLLRQNPTAVVLTALLVLLYPLTPQGSVSSFHQQRSLDNRLPAHVPLSAEVVNFQGGHFLRDLRITVVNRSTKPIYFLRLDLLLPEVAALSGGSNTIYGLALRYGRDKLVDLSRHAEPEDTPIGPGASHTFKIPEERWRGFERLIAGKNIPESAISRIELSFQVINFGDGTGLLGSSATPIPNTQAARAAADASKQEAGEVKIFSVGFDDLQHRTGRSTKSAAASFFKANTELPSQGCCGIRCLGTFKLIQSGVTCACGAVNAPSRSPCGSIDAVCSSPVAIQWPCIIGGAEVVCTDFRLNDCGT